MPQQDVDVAVVGGGPAGSAAATLLARRGWRVVLLERERFPREHVGESLLPASLPILKDLGVLDAVEQAGFVKKAGATMVWGSDSEPWSWYFRETNRAYPHAYQVHRPQFDQLLLDNAAANGVDVRQEHRVIDLDLEPQGARLSVESAGVASTIDARFVVDASGQTGLIARKLGLRRNDDFFRNLAVYAYFEGASHLAPPDEGNIFIESYPDGWFWKIPLSAQRTSVGAVVDSALGQEGIASLGLEPFFRQQLDQAPRTAALLADARLSDGPHVVRDWSYVAQRLVGDSHILVGDAACFVDPLFSSGVHLALSSAVFGSAFVTTALRRPEMAADAAAVYSELYLQQYRHFRELARLFYASNRTVESYFWEARKIVDADSTPRAAFIRAVAGQPPQGYERAVLRRGDAPAAFAQAVHLVEGEREGRRDAWDALSPGGDLRSAPLYRAVPRLAASAEVRRKPILENGEFVWADVLTSDGRPEGTPLSALVARLVAAIDGRRTVRDLLAALVEQSDSQIDEVVPAALTALQILYLEGAVEGIENAAPSG